MNKCPLILALGIDGWMDGCMRALCTTPLPTSPSTNTIQSYPTRFLFQPQSPKDAEKLKDAKERVYLKGFYEGVMKVGMRRCRCR